MWHIRYRFGNRIVEKIFQSNEEAIKFLQDNDVAVVEIWRE